MYAGVKNDSHGARIDEPPRPDEPAIRIVPAGHSIFPSHERIASRAREAAGLPEPPRPVNCEAGCHHINLNQALR